MGANRAMKQGRSCKDTIMCLTESRSYILRIEAWLASLLWDLYAVDYSRT